MPPPPARPARSASEATRVSSTVHSGTQAAAPAQEAPWSNPSAQVTLAVPTMPSGGTDSTPPQDQRSAAFSGDMHAARQELPDAASLLRSVAGSHTPRHRSASRSSVRDTPPQSGIRDAAPHLAADADASVSSIRDAGGDMTRPAVEPQQYLVFTASGKLVFASGGNDAGGWAYSQTGVMHALLALFMDDAPGDELHQICLTPPTPNVPPTRISFLSAPPLHVACCSAHDEPPDVMRRQLHHLCDAVVSLVSAARLHTLFSRMPNLDLRGLIGETHTYLDGVVNDMHAGLALPLDALPVLPMDATQRAALAAACIPRGETDARLKDLYIVLLVQGARLVWMAHARRHPPHPRDVLLLLSMVAHGPANAAAAPDDGAWVPMCLPHLAADRFVYVYAAPLCGTSVAGAAPTLVLVSGDRDGYGRARAWRKRAEKAVGSALAAAPGSDALPLGASGGYAADALGVPGLRHFVYASRRLAQCTAPERPAAYGTPAEWARLESLYTQALGALRGDRDAPLKLAALAPYAAAAQRAALPARLPPVAAPLRLQYLRTDGEAVLAWRTAAFELCVALHPPWLSKAAVVEAAIRFAAWARRQDKVLFAGAGTL